MQKSNFLKDAIRIAKGAAKILVKKQNSSKIKKWKVRGDFALDADYASEKYIIKEIKKKYPTHAVLAEESGNGKNKSEYLWIIDPLDGTLNYSHKTPLFTVSIALVKSGEPIASVIYAPALEELYTAEKGKGAYLNGKRIKVNKDKMSHCRIQANPNISNKLIKEISHKYLRNFGSSTLEAAYVAVGRASAQIRKGQDPYGNATAALLVREAGGKVTDLKGEKWELQKSKGIILSNKTTHRELLKIMKKAKIK